MGWVVRWFSRISRTGGVASCGYVCGERYDQTSLDLEAMSAIRTGKRTEESMSGSGRGWKVVISILIGAVLALSLMASAWVATPASILPTIALHRIDLPPGAQR